MKFGSALFLALSLATTSATAQDFSKLRSLATLGGDGKRLITFDYHPGKQQVFALDTAGYSLWDLQGMQQMKDGRLGQEIEYGQVDWVSNYIHVRSYGQYAALSPDGKATAVGASALNSFNALVFSTKDGLSVRAASATTAKPIAPAVDNLVSMQPSADTNLLLVTTEDRGLLYQVNPGQLLKTFTPLNASLWNAQFSPDETRVLLTDDFGLALYEIASGLRLYETRSSETLVSSTFSPDGKWVALGMGNGKFTVLDVESGATVSTFQSKEGSSWRTTTLAFSPDGKVLAAGSSQRGLNLWNAATGDELAVLGKGNEDIRKVMFTTDGKYLLSGSRSDGIQVWGIPNATPFGQPAQLTLNSTTTGASLVVDEVAFGPLDAAGQELTLVAGVPHHLVLTAPNARPYSTSVTLTPSETRTLTLNPVPLQGKLTLVSTPSGATIVLDGKVAGKTPLTLERLPAGPLAFTLKYAGYSDFQNTATVTETAPVVVNAALKALPGLSVTSTPAGASVLLNGQAYGTSPLVTSGLKPGAYTVTLKLKGYKDQVLQVTVGTSGITKVDSVMKK